MKTWRQKSLMSILPYLFSQLTYSCCIFALIQYSRGFLNSNSSKYWEKTFCFRFSTAFSEIVLFTLLQVTSKLQLNGCQRWIKQSLLIKLLTVFLASKVCNHNDYRVGCMICRRGYLIA